MSSEVGPLRSGMGEAGISTRSARILANFSSFDAEVRLAEDAYAKGKFEMAAFYASTAATIATHRHCGIFSSPRLEAILSAIGRQVSASETSGAFKRPDRLKKVLHVGSELSPVGGLTRMISRWIDADADRTNSLVLTQHRGTIPQHLRTAIKRSGGDIVKLNQSFGTRFDWARTLRRIAISYDVIILHIHCEDVVPILAFANQSGMPPVLFLNHADHLFWLGTSVAHMVLNLRQAAADISIFRRGIPSTRNFLLPTIVNSTVRHRSRNAAKLALGLPEDEIVLLSVARKPKYRSLDGVSFADRHVELLKKHPKAHLIVVGPGEPDDWRVAKSRAGGRITGLPEIADPQLYFEAADIYVNSYPFVSSTSMMEAAGYGLPVVTIFTLSDEARIFGINHVGLDGTSLVARTPKEYDALLDQLVVDAVFRKQKGDAVRQAIERYHVPRGWHSHLENAFKQAIDVGERSADIIAANATLEHPQLGPPDDLHEDIVGSEYRVAEINMVYMGALPFRQRLALWLKMRRRGEITGVATTLRTLLPEWLKRTINP